MWYAIAIIDLLSIAVLFALIKHDCKRVEPEEDDGILSFDEYSRRRRRTSENLSPRAS